MTIDGWIILAAVGFAACIWYVIQMEDDDDR